MRASKRRSQNSSSSMPVRKRARRTDPPPPSRPSPAAPPPQPVQRVAVEAGEQAAVAELLLVDAGAEAAAQDEPLALKLREPGRRPAGADRHPPCQLGGGGRPEG